MVRSERLQRDIERRRSAQRVKPLEFEGAGFPSHVATTVHQIKRVLMAGKASEPGGSFLVMQTTHKKNRESVEHLIDKAVTARGEHIDYVVQPVGEDRINVYIGHPHYIGEVKRLVGEDGSVSPHDMEPGDFEMLKKLLGSRAEQEGALRALQRSRVRKGLRRP